MFPWIIRMFEEYLDHLMLWWFWNKATRNQLQQELEYPDQQDYFVRAKDFINGST